MTSGLNLYVEMLKASREGREVSKWVNDHKPGDGLNVISMTGSFHNLGPGEQYVLLQTAFAVNSINDSAHFEIGYTSEGFCSGTFTPAHHHQELTTGAAKEYSAMKDENLRPPKVMQYLGDGAKCICMRANCSDADVEVTVGFSGWVEPETER